MPEGPGGPEGLEARGAEGPEGPGRPRGPRGLEARGARGIAGKTPYINVDTKPLFLLFSREAYITARPGGIRPSAISGT